TSACIGAAVLERSASGDGAGATTSGVMTGSFSCDGVCVSAASGIGDGIGVHATRFGMATSLGSLIWLGVTMVWRKLSGAGGSEMMFCLAYLGSPFCSTLAGAGALPVSISGRYSATL